MPEPERRRPSTAARRALWAVVALLIGYGSLYPFRFHVPGESPLLLLHLAPLWTRASDVFGNVLLFVPWSLCGWWACRGSARQRALPVLLGGLPYALLLQVLQLWLPMRVASLGDVFWNALGLVAGLLLAPRLRDAGRCLCLAILLLWLLGLLLPVWPTGLSPAWLRPLLAFQVLPTPVALVWHVAGGWLSMRLLQSLSGSGEWRAMALLAVVLAAVSLLPGARHDPSALVGLPLGVLCAQLGRGRTDGLLIVLIALVYTFDGLWPFRWRPVGVVTLLPFDSLLHGNMLNNLRHLCARLAIYAGVLWLCCQRYARLPPAVALLVVLWVGVVEGAQAWLVGRYADVGELFWALLAVALVQFAGPLPAQTAAQPAFAPQPAAAARGSEP